MKRPPDPVDPSPAPAPAVKIATRDARYDAVMKYHNRIAATGAPELTPDALTTAIAEGRELRAGLEPRLAAMQQDPLAARVGAVRFGASVPLDDPEFWEVWKAAGCVGGAGVSHLWGIPSERLEVALRRYWRGEGDAITLLAPLLFEAWGPRRAVMCSGDALLECGGYCDGCPRCTGSWPSYSEVPKHRPSVPSGKTEET